MIVCHTSDSPTYALSIFSDFPEEWLEPQNKVHMFHDTAERCCESHFVNKECKTRESSCTREGPQNDAGAGTTNTGPCVAPGWYPENIYRDGCSNASDFPPDWLDEPLRSSIFYSSSQACCDGFFKGKPCKTYDSGCTVDQGNASCESEWHPAEGTKGECTNDSNYPSSWTTSENRDSYFFATAQECCLRYNGSGMCTVRDACNIHADGVSYLDVTLSPTFGPSYAPVSLYFVLLWL